MDKQKKALITGVTGQDGSYLAELLLEKGYEVHGLYRRHSVNRLDRIEHLYRNPSLKKKTFTLHNGDLADLSSILQVLKEVRPDEIYNLGAQSHVRASFEVPEYTANSDALGTLRILDGMRLLGLEKETRFYQASTSEMFGNAEAAPQNEQTPFAPRSPYGVAKLYAHWITINYRDAYGIFACCGILFNHESPRRGEGFVTRKIVQRMICVLQGKESCLYLGNLHARRDWGYAKEYVEAMWRMLQQDAPDDYVIATGETHSVRECVELVCLELGIDLVWEGAERDERGIDRRTGKTLVAIDPYYFRPTEIDILVGDASKARRQLGWEPKTKFHALIPLMVREELARQQGG